MKFDDNQPIYLQIVGWIQEKILRQEWTEQERIPSVRELGAMLEVNPNTVMRSYEKLQAQQVIYNRRGIGYFVGTDAGRIIRAEQRADFMEADLPRLFERMELLGIGIGEIDSQYNQYRLKSVKDENKQ